MAQYYEVLSQGDTNQIGEESQQFFTNIDKNTIQYVVAPNQQPFTQQIVVSTDQLMVVEQSQIAYHTAPSEQFIIQETPIEFDHQDQSQQIVFMEANNTLPPQEHVVVDPAILQQPTIANQFQATNNQIRQAIAQTLHPNMLPRILNNAAAAKRNSTGNILTTKSHVARNHNTIQNYRKSIGHKVSNASQKLGMQLAKMPQKPPPVPRNNANAAMKSTPARTPKRNFGQFAQPAAEPDNFQTRYNNMALKDQQHQYQMQQHRQGPRQSQANYVIQPPNVQQRPPQQRPLPSYIPSSQIQQIIDSTPISEEYSDSIRMLVFLENGEQRLITFTLPKEPCTIQEILEQVNVPFQPETMIQVSEVNTSGINYLVTVGNVINEMSEEASDSSTSAANADADGATQSSSPEPVKELPKFVQGKLALCPHCGYLSEDFNRCMRCKTKLPDNVKSVVSPANPMTANNLKRMSAEKIAQLRGAAAAVGGNGPRITLKKRAVRAPKVVEHETMVISSDEEGETEEENSSFNKQIENLGSAVTISPISKEPTNAEIQKFSKINSESNNLSLPYCATTLDCRTIRIGSYRVSPTERVKIETSGFEMKVPHPETGAELNIQVDRNDIVKVLISFNSSMFVIFYYLRINVGETIRELLKMTNPNDCYYDPMSEKDETHRRITFLPNDITEEDQALLKKIYATPEGVYEELTVKEANNILIKTCPKDLSSRMSLRSQTAFNEVKQLLYYPPEGRIRMSINTEDYLCLAQDQFLNDVIIDFYLKYLVDNLPKERRDKIHVFSTFFYKRLTTKPVKASRKAQPAELDPNLTASQKRHARVRTWTKNVNIFEKDFVVVPINENAHWFLAIICFPGMEGCYTMDGLPYEGELPIAKKKSAKPKVATAKVPEKVESIEDPDLSDKDEAEGDDSDIESNYSDEGSTSTTTSTTATPGLTSPTKASPPKIAIRPPIKQPVIFIFDSLAGANRCRVVATLRDYLTCEHLSKFKEPKIFDKDNIKGACPKVPQQTNFTDCGLYVLQYVEHFFYHPLEDFYVPLPTLKNWFEEIIVTKKREDISNLLKKLMVQCGRDVSVLPNIQFPTVNGALIERELGEEDEDMFEDIGEHTYEPDEQEQESSEMESGNGEAETESDSSRVSPIKPSVSEGDYLTFTETVVDSAALTLGDIRTPSNRDTLSYLKNKRIQRHKTADGPELKKVKN